MTGNLRHYNRVDGLPLEDWIRPLAASAPAEPETGQDSTAADSLPQDGPVAFLHGGQDAQGDALAEDIAQTFHATGPITEANIQKAIRNP